MRIAIIIICFVGLLTFTCAQSINKTKKDREKRTIGIILGSIVKGLVIKDAVLQFLVNATANATRNANTAMQQQQQPPPPPAAGGAAGVQQQQPPPQSPPPPPAPPAPPAAPASPPARRPNGSKSSRRGRPMMSTATATTPPPPPPPPTTVLPEDDNDSGADDDDDGGSTEDTSTGAGDDTSEDNTTTAQDRIDSDIGDDTTIGNDIDDGPNGNFLSSNFFSREGGAPPNTNSINSFGSQNQFSGPFSNQFYNQGQSSPAHSYVKTNGYEFTNYHGQDQFTGPEKSYSAFRSTHYDQSYDPYDHEYGYYYRKRK